MAKNIDFPIEEEDQAKCWRAEDERDEFRHALEQIATGHGTGLTPAEDLAVCREIAEKALESILGSRL